MITNQLTKKVKSIINRHKITESMIINLSNNSSIDIDIPTLVHKASENMEAVKQYMIANNITYEEKNTDETL